MSTYLFITKEEFRPERVESNDWFSWSCSSTARPGDRAFVYVTGTGIEYEWRITSSAKPSKKWKFACDVEHIQTLSPPISISEIRELATKEEWSAPYQNFRGYRSILIPDDVSKRILGVRATRPSEESTLLADTTFVEGTPRQSLETIYERDPEARRQCILYYGTTCQGCGTDFEKVYGPVARGFIHVHHLTPLSQNRTGIRVDPIADMRPVCPNCHAVMHIRNKLISIEQLKRLLAVQSRRKKGKS